MLAKGLLGVNPAISRSSAHFASKLIFFYDWGVSEIQASTSAKKRNTPGSFLLTYILALEFLI
jgi:hypothetical protein